MVTWGGSYGGGDTDGEGENVWEFTGGGVDTESGLDTESGVDTEGGVNTEGGTLKIQTVYACWRRNWRAQRLAGPGFLSGRGLGRRD